MYVWALLAYGRESNPEKMWLFSTKEKAEASRAMRQATDADGFYAWQVRSWELDK